MKTNIILNKVNKLGIVTFSLLFMGQSSFSRESTEKFIPLNDPIHILGKDIICKDKGPNSGHTNEIYIDEIYQPEGTSFFHGFNNKFAHSMDCRKAIDLKKEDYALIPSLRADFFKYDICERFGGSFTGCLEYGCYLGYFEELSITFPNDLNIKSYQSKKVRRLHDGFCKSFRN